MTKKEKMLIIDIHSAILRRICCHINRGEKELAIEAYICGSRFPYNLVMSDEEMAANTSRIMKDYNVSREEWNEILRSI